MTSLSPVFLPSFILHIHTPVLKNPGYLQVTNSSLEMLYFSRTWAHFSAHSYLLSMAQGESLSKSEFQLVSLGIIPNTASPLLLFFFNKNEFSYFSLYKSQAFFKEWFKYFFLPGTFPNCSSLFSKSLFYCHSSSNLNSDMSHISCIIYSYFKWTKYFIFYIFWLFTSICTMMPCIQWSIKIIYWVTSEENVILLMCNMCFRKSPLLGQTMIPKLDFRD